MALARALMSVTDKSGLTELARWLREKGVEIIASGGTRRHLTEAGVETVELAAWTGSPECLDGRVKTLHPKVFGGILADPVLHAADLAEQDFPLIDLVVVNLYRFRETAADTEKSGADIVEAIDIGGPSLIRAAAKNHGRVSLLCDPGRYEEFMRHCDEGDAKPDADFRRDLAVAAFAHTRDYDIDIAAWFAGEDSLPGPGRELATLRYGENPQQGAKLHAWLKSETPYRQLSGVELSYNNLLDLGASLDLIGDLDGPVAAVIKHGNPCGLGYGVGISEALATAWSSDPRSAYGSVVAVSAKLDGAAAAFLAKKFIEVLVAPDYDDEAREILGRKKKLRLLQLPDMAAWRAPTRLRSVGPLLLVQDEDSSFVAKEQWRHAAGPAPDDALLCELDRAWRAVKHVKSNAIVVWSGEKLLGAGMGQTSRVDSCRIAVNKARELGHEVEGAVAASDAFFPFADGLEILADAGLRAVVQPGGSMRDEEVLARAEELGITVMLTGRRHFRH